jgi:hypothetical protein
MPGLQKKILIGLFAMTLLSPLGILLPKMFTSGKAWGEWSTEKVSKDNGYVPQGMQKDASMYNAPVADYNLGREQDPVWKQSGSYIISAVIGIGAIGLITLATIKLLPKK